MTIWHMRFACCIPKAKDTHSEYAIGIAFLQQQWLRERVSLLRYTHIAIIFKYTLAFVLQIRIITVPQSRQSINFSH